MMAQQTKPTGFRKYAINLASLWVGLLAGFAPLAALAMMDMPYSPMKAADEGSTELEMGKKFGKFMEGFSRQMEAPREGSKGRNGPEDRGGYRGEDRREDRREEYRGGNRSDSYYDERRYNDDRHRDRYRNQTDGYGNPFSYDPWGARSWQGSPLLGYDPWGGYSPQELFYDRNSPYDSGYGGYGNGPEWGSGYPPGWGGGYGPGYGYGYGSPYRRDYRGYDSYSRGDDRHYNHPSERRDRSYSMTFDNPWDSFWGRSWPFSNRSWEW